MGDRAEVSGERRNGWHLKIGDELPDPVERGKKVRVVALEPIDKRVWPLVSYAGPDGRRRSTGWPAFAILLGEEVYPHD